MIVHGPNLNLLGIREPNLYGTETLEDINSGLLAIAQELNVELRILQSNHEGVIIDYIQSHRKWAHGMLINPAAYTHTSIAIRDVITAIQIAFVEVHLSDISQREPFRKHSYFSDIALKTFMGEKSESYRKALKFLVGHLKDNK